MMEPSTLPEDLKSQLEQFLNGHPPADFKLNKRELKEIIYWLRVDLSSLSGAQRTDLYVEVKTWIRNFAESQQEKSTERLKWDLFNKMQMHLSKMAPPPPNPVQKAFQWNPNEVIIIDSDDEEDPAVTAERMAREEELRDLAAVDKKPNLPDVPEAELQVNQPEKEPAVTPRSDVSMEIESPMAELQVSEPEKKPAVMPQPESQKVASKSSGEKRGQKRHAEMPAAGTSVPQDVAVSESTAAPEGKIYELDKHRFFDPFGTSSFHLNLKPQQLSEYAYKLSLRDKKLYATPQIAPLLSDMSNIDYKHLFFWPNVALVLSLPHIEIVRKILPNHSLELIVPGTPLQATHLARINRGIKCYVDTPAEGDLCAPMIKKYLKSVRRSLERSTNNPHREIRVFIERFLDEFAPFERCSQGVEYTRYISPYRYHRVLGAAEEGSDEHSPDLEQLFLRQITAPEVVFKITRCAFTEPPGDDVEAVLTERSLTRAISVRCVECAKSFCGNLLVLHIRSHIKNYCNEIWSCSNCPAKMDQKNLVENGWKHDCISAD